MEFELEMTELFVGMSDFKVFCLLFCVILLVNSALFWAWKLVQAVLPWKLQALRNEMEAKRVSDCKVVLVGEKGNNKVKERGDCLV